MRGWLSRCCAETGLGSGRPAAPTAGGLSTRAVCRAPMPPPGRDPPPAHPTDGQGGRLCGPPGTTAAGTGSGRCSCPLLLLPRDPRAAVGGARRRAAGARSNRKTPRRALSTDRGRCGIGRWRGAAAEGRGRGRCSGRQGTRGSSMLAAGAAAAAGGSASRASLPKMLSKVAAAQFRLCHADAKVGDCRAAGRRRRSPLGGPLDPCWSAGLVDRRAWAAAAPARAVCRAPQEALLGAVGASYVLMPRCGVPVWKESSFGLSPEEASHGDQLVAVQDRRAIRTNR